MTPLRCEPNSRKKNIGSNVATVFSCMFPRKQRVFHGVLQCQINDGIRRQKEEAQIGCAVSGEVDTNQDVGRRRNVTLFTANFMVNGRFFFHMREASKELWLSSVW